MTLLGVRVFLSRKPDSKRFNYSTLEILNLLLLIPLLLLAGCSGRKSDNGKVRLTYWPSTNPHEVKLAEFLTDEWNREHPDTLIIIQPLPEGRSGEEVLVIAAAGRTTPDICSNVPPVIVPLLAKAKALVELDRFEDGRSFIDSRLPDGLPETFVGIDGNLYQIPWKGNPIMVQYNLGILREVGIEKLPETWSEWKEVGEKVTRDRDGDGQLDCWMANVQVESEWRRRLFDFYTFYIAHTNGGTLLKGNKIDFDNQHAVDVLEFFAEGFKKGYYPRTIFTGDQFLRGRLAAFVTGPWNISHTEKLKPEGFEYTFGPIPMPDGSQAENYTFGDPKSIGIFSTTEHPEAAWMFVKHIISRTADLKLLEICNQLPLRRDLLTDTLYSSYFEANPLMVTFAEKVPYTRGFDQHPALQEVFDALNNSFDACCVNGVIDAETAVKEAADRGRHILKMRGE
jgi:multiple sugar transport system substrate-binding protein